MSPPRLFVACALALTLAACLAEAVPGDTDPFDVDLTEGAADGTGVSVVDARLGDTLDLRVSAEPGAPRHSMAVVRLRLAAGTRVAALMRRTEGGLNPYLLLKDEDKVTLAEGRDQGAVPTAAEADALLVAEVPHDGTYYLFAAGTDLVSGGRFELRLRALPAAPIRLGQTDAAIRILGQALRRLEPERARWVGAGVLRERPDAGIELGDPTGVPLSERAGLSGLIAELGRTRTELIAQYGRDGDAATDIAAALVVLWGAAPAL